MAVITLNPNIVQTSLVNMIINQTIYSIDVAEPTLANKLRTTGGLYGDSALFYAADVVGSYDFQNDAEAASLLELHRNQRQYIQRVVIDQFRQTRITVDEYLTKQAWSEAGSFSKFIGILSGSLAQTKKIFDNGLINTFVGTYTSTAPAALKTVNMTDVPAATTAADVEATARIRGQRISKVLADTFVELADNRRDYNELNYLRAYNPNELIMVWNAQLKNQITDIDLPTVYHKDGVSPMAGVDVDQRYFGTRLTSGGTVGASVVRTLVEMDITVGSDTIRAFPGDALPTGTAYLANEAYTQDSTIIGKLISRDSVPFMSAFQTGTTFFNPRSLTTNHYLTWGYNTLVAIKYMPFVTFKLISSGTI